MLHPRIGVFTILLIIALACFSCAAGALEQDRPEADDLYLVTFKDGKKVAGRILRIDSEVIKIETIDDLIVIREFDDVLSIKPYTGAAMLVPREPWTGAISGTFGMKNLRREDYYPAHEHVAFGLRGDLGKETWPLHAAAAVIYSNGDGTLHDVTYTLDTLELSLGIVKTFHYFEKVIPYLGGGAVYIRADSDEQGMVDRETTRENGGVYVETGVRIPVYKNFFAGIDLRYAWVEDAYDGSYGTYYARLGGLHFGGCIGYTW